MLIKYYINTFLIYSFVGFLIEMTAKLLFFPDMESGILRGPWLPIYGLGAVIIVFVSRYITKKVNINKWGRLVLILLTVMLLVTILEYLGGNLIEFVFDKTFWDYSHMKFNFGSYISLEMTLVWGLASLLFLYIAKPLTDKFIEKIPIWITTLAFIFFLSDLIATFVKGF